MIPPFSRGIHGRCCRRRPCARAERLRTPAAPRRSECASPSAPAPAAPCSLDAAVRGEAVWLSACHRGASGCTADTGTDGADWNLRREPRDCAVPSVSVLTRRGRIRPDDGRRVASPPLRQHEPVGNASTPQEDFASWGYGRCMPREGRALRGPSMCTLLTDLTTCTVLRINPGRRSANRRG